MTDQYVAPTEGMSEGFVPTQEVETVGDTAQLQFQELLRFASILGFEFAGKNFQRVTENRLLKSVTTLSFNRFVKLYQTRDDSPIPEITLAGKYAFVAYDPYADGKLNAIPFYASDLKFALETRQLHKIKLQMNTKGLVTPMSHKVKFTNEEVGQEFYQLFQEALAAEEVVLPTVN